MTEAPKKIELPILGIAMLMMMVGLLLFMFFRHRSLMKRYGALLKKYAMLVEANDDQKTVPVLVEQQEQADTEQAENMEEEKRPSDETTQDVVLTEDVDESELPPTLLTIPASLRYKISIENENSFYAFSTGNSGLWVHVFRGEGFLNFVLCNQQEELQTETRIWPVSEKEVGTILNRMLQTPKTN